MGAEKNGRFSAKTKCSVHSGLRSTPMISVFSTASRLLRIAACTAHQPRTLHRPPRVGTQVPAAECRVPGRGPATTGAPERRKMRGYTLCRGGVYADQLTPSRSASDDAFSVANNHRQINRYIVDSILQYI